jgi:hypothetical protein
MSHRGLQRPLSVLVRLEPEAPAALTLGSWASSASSSSSSYSPSTCARRERRGGRVGSERAHDAPCQSARPRRDAGGRRGQSRSAAVRRPPRLRSPPTAPPHPPRTTPLRAAGALPFSSARARPPCLTLASHLLPGRLDERAEQSVEVFVSILSPAVAILSVALGVLVLVAVLVRAVLVLLGYVIAVEEHLSLRVRQRSLSACRAALARAFASSASSSSSSAASASACRALSKKSSSISSTSSAWGASARA